MSEYSHGDWYCKPASEEEAKEVIDRAVASGADNKYCLSGKAMKHPYGVVNGFVDFNAPSLWADATEYTIEQVRELFPLPVDQQQWNGEGFPPVGVEFEFSQGGISWSERVMLFNDGITCLMASKKYPTNRWHYKSDDPCLRFRPIRSERERWVEMAAIALHKDAVLTPEQASYAAGAIYDALKSGSLKAPEVE